jgi:hypothetical protein
MDEYRLDRELVDAFVSGGLSPDEEDVLADQVARVVPFHWNLPDPLVAALSRLTRHLGGEAALLHWLDRHPGRARTVARLYMFIGLLDRLSAEPAVVTALCELRASDPYPPGLAGHLVPQTTTETLADLAQNIEFLVGDGRVDAAARVVDATGAMLEKVMRRAAEVDPDLDDLRATAREAGQRVLAALEGTA